MPAKEAQVHAKPIRGVPLGGVGSGFIEFGADSRFRNIAINNNRALNSEIPVSRGGFFAVRAAQDGSTWTRILHPEIDVPFDKAGIEAPLTPASELTWVPLYPFSNYRLDAPDSPINLRWTVMAPIIPYDTDASTLPVLLFMFEAQNPRKHPVNVSILFNWENVFGCTRDDTPEDRGTIAVILPQDENLDGAEEDAEASGPSLRTPVGLLFGRAAPYETNAEGHYALVARWEHSTSISVAAWDERDPTEVRALWQRFREDGALDESVAPRIDTHSGAICVASKLAPREQRTFVFALAWFCPRFVVDGHDQGNGYVNNFPHAPAVANHALTYQPYYLDAVKNWQSRFMNSSLPQWLSKSLIDCNHVLSTNTLYTRDGRFAMFETSEDPVTGALDRRFHSSLGLLLFFPRLEIIELESFASAEPEDDPDRLFRYLGTLCTDNANHGHVPHELMDLGPKMVLMAYRDYCLTGRSAMLDRIFPRLKYIMRYLVEKDRNDDGLPEERDFTITFDEWIFSGETSYAASLWLAAIRAYAKLARRIGEQTEATTYDELFPRAARSFVQRLWNQDGGCFYFHDNPRVESREDGREPAAHGCHSGQLAGQWYADFLALGTLVPEAHIRKALDAIYHNHEETPPVTTWPAFHITHYSCLDIVHGNADRGLQSVKRARDRVVRNERTYDQPLCWDLQAEKPQGWGRHRHFGAMALWHVLYALEGFLLNIPDKVLCIRPNLPTNIHELSVPLFSPVSFGWLDFSEEDDDASTYSQRIRVSFDSPVTVRTIILRVPARVTSVLIKCLGPDGLIKTDYDIKPESDTARLRVRAKSDLTVQAPLTIEITQPTTSEFMLLD